MRARVGEGWDWAAAGRATRGEGWAAACQAACAEEQSEHGSWVATQRQSQPLPPVHVRFTPRQPRCHGSAPTLAAWGMAGEGTGCNQQERSGRGR